MAVFVFLVAQVFVEACGLFIVVLGLSLVAACRNFSSWRSMGFRVLGLGCCGAWALAAPRHVGT